MNPTPERHAAQRARQQSTPNRNVQVYYDRDGVTVTDESVEVHGLRYPISQLDHLRVMHAQYSDLTINSSLIATTIVIAIARVWDRLGTNGWVGALAVLAVPVVLALIGTRLRRRSHVLIAEHRGFTVVIFAHENQRTFNQIARALRRAQEARRS
jgi:hypothetical protein